MNKEEYDFNEFMIKFQHKIDELQTDFNNLSDNNKAKVFNLLNQYMTISGITEFINILGNFKNQ